MHWGDVGIAGIKQLDQRYHPEQASETRLSWNLDMHSTGGWRAGTFIDLGLCPDGWRKLLFYRMPTAQEDQLERWRVAQESIGHADEEMAIGTQLQFGLRSSKTQGAGDLFVVQRGIYQGFERQLIGANRHLVLFEGGLMGENQEAATEHRRAQLFKGCEIVRQFRAGMSNRGGATGGGATGSGTSDSADEDVLCKIQLRCPDVEWAVVRPSTLPVGRNDVNEHGS